MTKKKIIQIIIIIIGFAGSGFVIYNGMFKSSSPSPATSSGTEQSIEAISSKKILPLGESLDFDILQKNNLQFGLLEVPQLNPILEVGIPESQLIKPPPKKTIEDT